MGGDKKRDGEKGDRRKGERAERWFRVRGREDWVQELG